MSLIFVIVNDAAVGQVKPAGRVQKQAIKVDRNILRQLLERGVLYQNWGPGPARLRVSPGIIAKLKDPIGPAERVVTRYKDASDEVNLKATGTTADALIAEQGVTLSMQSPAPAVKFIPGVEGVDAGIAVGNQYIIVAHDHRIAFFDKSGNSLIGKGGYPTNMQATVFFDAFLSPTKQDGSINYDNINRHLKFPAGAPINCNPEESPPKFPCINEFYDTRALFDAESKRFFILSAARHQLWRDDEASNPGGKFNALARRYVAFAISKTEDPRDGFHQYMLTESNYRDWPRISVNGNAFVIAHNSGGDAGSYVAYVLSVVALKNGKKDPPRFSYTQNDIGVNAVVPVTHFVPPNGLTFLLRPSGTNIDIFAFPQPEAGWQKPAIMKTSVLLTDKPSMLRAGAIYRNGRIYFTCVKKVQEGTPERFSVRAVRIPVQVSGNTISASTSSSQGFLDWLFGKNAPEDAPSDLVSYEMPSMAVNKDGDMLFGYGRSPVLTQKTLMPEARYTYWYAGEAKQRRSRLLQIGSYQPVADNLPINFYGNSDFTSTVVDPADDKTFWTALFYGDASRPGAFKTVIGKIVP